MNIIELMTHQTFGRHPSMTGPRMRSGGVEELRGDRALLHTGGGGPQQGGGIHGG